MPDFDNGFRNFVDPSIPVGTSSEDGLIMIEEDAITTRQVGMIRGDAEVGQACITAEGAVVKMANPSPKMNCRQGVAAVEGQSSQFEGSVTEDDVGEC